MLTQAKCPLLPYPPGRLWAKHSGQLEWGNTWGGGQKYLTGPHPICGQPKLSNIPTDGWIIDPDVHGLLDGSCNIVCLPTHNGEVVHPAVMICGVGMIIHWGRVPWDVPWSFIQRSLPNPPCTPHHMPTYHLCTCILICSSVSCYPHPLRPPGGFWWCCLPWSGLGLPFSTNVLKLLLKPFVECTTPYGYCYGCCCCCYCG